ncbi:MAG TPA: dethiobiotin synthase [Phenylobacterium sp.]|nr:dethiobiotin synthase [Phenylobacterium sp.]
MTALFVAGAHTDVGKTHVACALLRAARARGLTVDALKPVVSGFDVADWAQSDPGRLIAALGLGLSGAALDATSPWIFAAPLAPPMAAALEGRDLTIADVARFCADRRTPADLFLVEGVGGVMSPLASDGVCLDLMRRLALPTLLVGGSYLGAISHTLTAVETLRAHGLPIAAVVVSEAADPAAPDFGETVALTRRYAGDVRVAAAPRSLEAGWADALLTGLDAPAR